MAEKTEEDLFRHTLSELEFNRHKQAFALSVGVLHESVEHQQQASSYVSSPFCEQALLYLGYREKYTSRAARERILLAVYI